MQIHSCFNATPTVSAVFKFIFDNMHYMYNAVNTSIPAQWFQQIPGILDTTVTINSKSGTLYTPY